MPLPDDGIPGAQALAPQAQSTAEPQAQSSAAPQAQSTAEPPLDPGLAVRSDSQPRTQLEPRQGVKSAKCEVFPLTGHYTVIADFQNWDPNKDGKAALFEKTLAVKLGRDNISGFWWKRFPPKTRFTFHMPYSAGDNQETYTLISDAIFDYSGDAKIRTTVYHF